MRAIHASFVVAVLSIAVSTTALDPAKSPKDYVHRVWQVENGLPQASVTGITQSSEGFLWIGTFGGLVRFNGSQFLTLPPNPNGPGPRISYVFQASNGTLWVGGELGGLWKYSPSSGTWKNKSVLADKRITVILGEPDGTAWIGTERDGLICLTGDRVESCAVALPSRHVTSLGRDQKNNLWVGTTAGLVRVHGTSSEVYTRNNGLSSNIISSLVISKKGDLFVGTSQPASVAIWRGGRFSVVIDAAALSNASPMALLEDRESNLWVGTFGGGLVRYFAGNVAIFNTSDNLSDSAVRCLFEDGEGNLWIGTNAGGLNLFRDAIFQVVNANEGLVPDQTLAVIEDNDGSILTGLNCGGVMKIAAGKVTRESTTHDLANACVWSLLRTKDGALWVGTWGEGAIRIKDGKRTDYAKDSPIEDKVALALFEDKQGGVWVGTREQGATRFVNGVVDRKVRKSDGLPANDVRAIAEDRKGNIWLATSGGLGRVHSKGVATYTTKSGLAINSLRALFLDSDDNLWIGTYGGGLALLQDEKIVSITSRDGLVDDVVSWIGEDRQGRLWLSGNRGVFRVGRLDLLNRASGSGEKIYPVSYGKEDGLKTVECSGGFQPAGVIARDGRIWIPTLHGLAVIDPTRILTRGVRQAIVDHLVIDGQRVATTEIIKLSAGRHNVEFHFTCLDLVALDKAMFRYRFEGFDPDWVKAPSARVASYGSLPPGDYVFSVQASTADGGWGPSSPVITLHLPEPFWSAWWFRFSLPILLGALVFALGRWQRLSRTRQELDRLKLTYEAITGVLVALRQPLQVARARLEMMERRGRDSTPPVQVDAALEAIDRMQRLLSRAEQVHLLSESGQQIGSGDLKNSVYDEKGTR